MHSGKWEVGNAVMVPKIPAKDGMGPKGHMT